MSMSDSYSASKIDASKIATILNCRCPTVGLDMEWRTPRPVSLIQISSDSKIFLVDTIPCTTSVDTAQVPDPEYANAICDALIHLFTEQRVRKIGFSFGSDMRQIHPVFPQIKNSTLHNFVDLQALVPNLSSFSQAASKPQKIRPKKAPYDKKGKTAAPAKKSSDMDDTTEEESGETSSKGHRLYSLARLVYEMMDQFLDKTQQSSNWDRRPLLESQIEYASLDAYVLVVLMRLMVAAEVFEQKRLESAKSRVEEEETERMKKELINMGVTGYHQIMTRPWNNL